MGVAMAACSEWLKPKPLSIYTPESAFVDARGLRAAISACDRHVRDEFYGDPAPLLTQYVLSDMTVEGMIKIVYDLLKDKLNIAKITFTSGVNSATQEYPKSGSEKDRCPLCGIALNTNGVCPKCAYKHAR